jgi:methyl-accepting chemotaxis protein
LRDYLPEDGTYTDLYLRPEWEPFGLRIFVPSDRRIEFYPEIIPNDITAQKLAEALLGDLSRERAEWVILAVPDPGGGVSVCRLPISAFEPLVGRVEWHCAIAAEITAAAVDTKADEARARMEDGIESAFRAAADTHLIARLEQQRKLLESEAGRLRKEAETRRQRLSELRAAVEASDQFMAGAVAELDRCRAGVAAIVDRLQESAAGIGQLQAAAREMEVLSAQIQQLARDAAETRRLIQEARRPAARSPRR